MWKAFLAVLTALPRLVRLLARYLRGRADRAAIRRIRDFRKAAGEGDTEEVARSLDDLFLRERRRRRDRRGLPPSNGVPPR